MIITVMAKALLIAFFLSSFHPSLCELWQQGTSTEAIDSLEKDGAECKSTTLSKAHLRRHQGWLWLTTLSLLGTTRWWCTCKSLNLASPVVRCIPLLFLTSRKCFLSLLLGWPKNWGFIGVFLSHFMKNPNKLFGLFRIQNKSHGLPRPPLTHLSTLI